MKHSGRIQGSITAFAEATGYQLAVGRAVACFATLFAVLIPMGSVHGGTCPSPRVQIESRIVEGSRVKIGTEEFIQTAPPKRIMYLKSKVRRKYDKVETSDEEFPFGGGIPWNEAGRWYQHNHQHDNGALVFTTNPYTDVVAKTYEDATIEFAKDSEDYRKWHLRIQEVPSCWDEQLYEEIYEDRFEAIVATAEGNKWSKSSSTAYRYHWEDHYCSEGPGHEGDHWHGWTNGPNASLTPVDDNWFYIVDTPVIIDSRKRRTTTTPPPGGQHYSEETLDNEYTTALLLRVLNSTMGTYPPAWSSTADYAEMTLSADELTATLRRMQYRFKVYGLDPEKAYTLRWLENWNYTRGISIPRSRSVTFKGTSGEKNITGGEAKPTVPCTVTVSDVSLSDEEGCIVGCDSKTAKPVAGAASIANNSVSMKVDLGVGQFGEPMGALTLEQFEPSALIATPALLEFRSDSSEAETILINGEIRQIRAPQVLANIVTLTDHKYMVQLFYSPDVGAKVSGIYTTTGSEFKSFTVENPDAEAANTRVNISIVGGTTRLYQYRYVEETKGWILTYPGNLSEEETIRVEDAANHRVELRKLTRPPGGATVRESSETYQRFDWGVAKVQERIGAGAEAKVTTYSYLPIGFPTANGTAPLQQVVHHDGSWEYYQYDSQGRREWVYRAFGNQGPTTTLSLCRATWFSYAPVGTGDVGSLEPDTPRTEIDYLLGHEVGRRYRVVTPSEKREIVAVARGAAWNAADNLVTVTKFYSSGAFSNWRQSIRRPDGTMIFFSYINNPNGTRTKTVTEGAPNVPDESATSIVAGRRIVTEIGSFGEVLSEIVTDIQSGVVLESRVYSNFDALRRAQRVTHLGGLVEDTTHACCGIESFVDRDRVTTVMIYDAMGRKVAEERLSIMTTNVLDAAGHVLETRRIGTDGGVITNRQALYDTAGEMTRETNALLGVTQFSETKNGQGQVVRTTTYPDLGTRIETLYKDGTLQSVTGTAVHPVSYLYAIDLNSGSPDYRSEFTEETKLDGAGLPTFEKFSDYVDFAGRPYKRLYAAASAPYPTELQVYYPNGQLWKRIDADGVTTLYRYNGQGELEVTALDLDRDGIVDDSTSGTDRVTKTVTSYLATGAPGNERGMPIKITQTTMWTTPDSTSVVTVSKTESTLDGFWTWQTLYKDQSTPVTTITQNAYSGNTRTVTRTLPSQAYTVSSFLNGQLESTTERANGGAQVGKTSFQYDNHGRLWRSIDERNGTTTLLYNNADQLRVTETPVPGTGAGAQRTITEYNTSLRPYLETQPDNTTVSREFFETGLLKKTYGSRTYPVEYTYYPQGRMRTMKTWQNYPSSGAATTTWNYHPYRGWLAGKLHEGQTVGTEYTYTPGGRLKTRTWARTGTGGQRIGTTYTYGFDDGTSGNDHGDLLKIVYANDPAGTPQTDYEYDRLGRRWKTIFAGTTTTHSYNDANLLSGESFDGGTLSGLTTTFGFDGYLRRNTLSANTPTAISHSFGYDTASRLEVVTDGAFTSTFQYHPNSRLISGITHRESGVTRLSETRGYDFLNRLSVIESVPAAGYRYPVRFGYSYNDANQRDLATLADGSYWDYDYDALGQVTSGKKRWSGGTAVPGAQYEYVFDTIGNRLSTKAGGDLNGLNLQPASYTPNLLNQYRQRTVPGAISVTGLAEESASVSVNGNSSVYRNGAFYHKEIYADNASAPVWQSITVSSSPGGTASPGSVFHPKTPELYDEPSTPLVNEGFDADGNQLRNGRWNYTWDAENRLIRMVAATAVGPQQRLAFEYDAAGRRIRKTVWNNTAGSGTPALDVKFLYDGWLMFAELDASSGNAVIRSYVWGQDLSGSREGAGGVGGLLAMRSGSTCHFAAFDGNGNVAALVDGTTGLLSAQYEYGPFGELIRVSGPMGRPNPFRFSRKYTDEESGHLYYGYRYYNPSTGRWLSRDPIAERGGANLYGFVDNNPENRFDALGLQALPVPVPPGGPPIFVLPPPGTPPNIIPFPTPVRPIGPPQVAGCIVVAVGGWYLGDWIGDRTGIHDGVGDWLGGIIAPPITGGAGGTWPGSPFPGGTPDPTTLLLVNPGTCGKCNNGCKPCPPNSPAWEINEPGHGSTTTHWHWIEYNQIPPTYKGTKYKPCDCVPQRMTSPTKPPGA